MEVIQNSDWRRAAEILARPAGDLSDFRRQVAPLLDAVRTDGDKAVHALAERFDGVYPQPVEATTAEFDAAESVLSAELKNAVLRAYANLLAFHEAQKEPVRVVETQTGVFCWRKSVPIDKVGLYVPGGTAPLFSTVLMLGVPAQIAACREIVLCTPPRRDGSVHPAVLFAARLCGIRRVFKIGGAQAIAAMAYGTETVPAVWKIFGPGNPWVTAAKQLVGLDGVAVDLPAGPSELAVIADASADPAFVAADLLSQAEHGTGSQVVLFTPEEGLIKAVQQELERQLAVLPRRTFAEGALSASRAVLVNHLDEAMDWANAYAPEHLILHVQNPEYWAEKVRNAGSVFLGGLTPESAGDYASGTNHTLPTGGWARAAAGVSLDSFVKKITFQKIDPQGLQDLGSAITEMARAEGLEAHARAVDIRLQKIKLP
ncbi:MAG: histidinol dehydrogenase [Saprospiraceae bacterium]|nr:histidinol dehydrogenase [Saprospiraceae bacterium]